ncbi:hypothetical protein DFQ27_003815, partial [Actinomortierella ambigua]
LAHESTSMFGASHESALPVCLGCIAATQEDWQTCTVQLNFPTGDKYDEMVPVAQCRIPQFTASKYYSRVNAFAAVYKVPNVNSQAE